MGTDKTPGLGAEINTTEFESQFLDKWIYEGGSFISVAVVKGGADKSDRHEVDGISGGTITSKALEAMLREGLVKYENYFMENRK
ncbi:MAG: FMN-binding protein [Bacteroidales bacterium]|nr:FMN-binding protein [Bacteroidales bacterium]